MGQTVGCDYYVLSGQARQSLEVVCFLSLFYKLLNHSTRTMIYSISQACSFAILSNLKDAGGYKLQFDENFIYLLGYYILNTALQFIKKGRDCSQDLLTWIVIKSCFRSIQLLFKYVTRIIQKKRNYHSSLLVYRHMGTCYAGAVNHLMAWTKGFFTWIDLLTTELFFFFF